MYFGDFYFTSSGENFQATTSAFSRLQIKLDLAFSKGKPYKN